MRLQFLPLALCLFCALIMTKNDVFAVSESAVNAAKPLNIAVFKTKTKKDPKKANLSDIAVTTDVSTAKTGTQNYTIVSASDSGANSSLKENSYNYFRPDGVNTDKNSKENEEKAAQAEFIEANSFGEGLFYGFAIMVILLNLVCFFLFDEKLFLFFSLSLVTVSSLLFFSDGLMPLIGLERLATSLTFEALLVLASCTFGAWFASGYLNIKDVFPKMGWISMLLLSSSALLLFINALSGFEVFASAAIIGSFTVIGLYFLAGVYLFSKKNYPKFYVIAYSIPLLFAIDYFVFRNLGLEFLMTQPGHIKAAVLVEMLLLTYAIVYRMKAIKEENELRQTELRIFLKRQEVMNRKNAMQLMEDVYLENLIMHYDLDGFEIKLLQYISEGKDNVKIARKLKTTEAEIEEVTKELYHKLEISEQIQEDYRMVDAQADYIYN